MKVVKQYYDLGYYFSQSKTHQDAGNDYHQCSDNSGSGWEDLNKDPDEQTMAWPAFCRGFCDLIDNRFVQFHP